jgi:hypothetical protein
LTTDKFLYPGDVSFLSIGEFSSSVDPIYLFANDELELKLNLFFVRQLSVKEPMFDYICIV